MTVKTPVLLCVAAVLAGCATAPRPLRGEFAPLVPLQASEAQATGDAVRWGGRIVSVTPDERATCFEILGRDLGDTARPTRVADESNGRFLACRAGFYDPAIFTSERDVTVTGRIEGYELRPIGDYEYRYPRVAADVIYLWPERTEYRYDPYPVSFWPMYRPYFWGGYYRPVRVPYRQPAEAPSKP
ncbi:Slp family lipoprotein [Chiayiivirga flava]|uniref:Outer membrane lipoprotein n=1 Tax=Chiayiivirga flava TaxID=659595 RepID=A0A7W8D2R1_9GAMM|nr:Slp family lipoprotein [Chiayiivirga flava]MBB5206809.1 outer membrane lipoprotein [Chiayiivirga flava]